MSIPTTLLLPSVFKTGAGAVRHHPAYGASRPIRTTDHWVATSCLSSWLWKRLAPGRGFEPQPTGSKPMVLTVTPARNMVGRVGFEPTTFPMSRFYRPLASANLHTDPCRIAQEGRGAGGEIRTPARFYPPLSFQD